MSKLRQRESWYSRTKKELEEMDYKEKYEKALELAKQYKENGSYDADFLDDIFPELAGSEDEKIMRCVLNCIENAPSDCCIEVSRKEMRDWLEKQKEQPQSAIEVLVKAGLKPYKDGDQWCILAGDNIQEGICGFGNTIDEALYQFLMEILENQKEQNEGHNNEHDYIPLEFKDYLINRLKSIRRSEEDERIREELIFFLKEEIPQCSIKEHADKLKEFVSYLEKKEEQKPSFSHDVAIWDSGLKTGIEIEKKQKEHKNFRKLYEEVVNSDWFKQAYEGKSLGEEEKQKEQIPYIDFVIKPHKGDDNNPYDMRVSEAQEYAIKRGFGTPLNDGEVYVDERHMTQTIGNILRWADEHPKEQKPITESKRLANEVVEYLTKCGYSPVLKDDSKKEHFHIDIPRHKDDFWQSKEYKHCRSVLGEYYMEGDYGGDTYTLYIWREKKEQKPEWTEADENMLSVITYKISQHQGNDERSLFTPDEAEFISEMEDKFKSLRPQPKAEWSMEDECRREGIIQWLREYQKKFNPEYDSLSIESIESLISWLKSLRPSWEPSEEQMEALQRAVNKLAKTDVADSVRLSIMYDNLKKLI